MRRPMSGFGTLRALLSRSAMSAFGGKADIDSRQPMSAFDLACVKTHSVI